MLLITLAAVLISGCASSSPSSPPPTGTAAASGAPEVSTSGETTTISGSQSDGFNVDMTKGGYLFDIKSEDTNVKLDYAGSEFDLPMAYSAGDAGWYEQSFIKLMPTDGKAAFTIRSAAPYVITMSKLPAGTPVTPPQTFTGKGAKALGPITLKAGTANITISCPDANDAGFNVDSWDVSTNTLGAIGNNAESGTIQNNYQVEKAYNVPADGDYFFMVITNGNAAWTVDVSQ